MEHWNALINKSHACNEIHEQSKCYILGKKYIFPYIIILLLEMCK